MVYVEFKNHEGRWVRMDLASAAEPMDMWGRGRPEANSEALGILCNLLVEQRVLSVDQLATAMGIPMREAREPEEG